MFFFKKKDFFFSFSFLAPPRPRHTLKKNKKEND